MEYEKIWNIARIFPEIFPYMCGLFNLGYPSILLTIIILLCYISLICNVILKNLFSYLYQSLGVTNLPLLGVGNRPKDSVFCGTFSPNCQEYKDIQGLKKNLNFGMPSGHATCVFIVGTFLLLQIWKEQEKLELNEDNDDDDENNKYQKMNKYNKFSNPFKIKDKKKLIIVKLIQSLLIISFIFLICYSRIYIEKCHTVEQVFVGGMVGIGTIYLYSIYENNIIDCMKNNKNLYLKMYFISLIIITLSMFF